MWMLPLVSTVSSLLEWGMMMLFHHSFHPWRNIVKWEIGAECEEEGEIHLDMDQDGEEMGDSHHEEEEQVEEIERVDPEEIMEVVGENESEAMGEGESEVAEVAGGKKLGYITLDLDEIP